jgi:DNA-binding PadR family transcriptional regulator
MRDRDWFFGMGPWEWWTGARGRGRGRSRRRQWFEAGDMKYVILKLLRDKSMHGYEVMKELEEHTHGCYKPSPGTVYPTLQWLEDEGLVSSEEVEGKKVYSITAAGREFLEEHKGTVEEIFERVEDMIDNLLNDPMPDVTRQVGKLVGQVYRTTWRLRDDEQKMREVAKLLERTAEELEQLRG